MGRRPINSHLASLEHWRPFPNAPNASQDMFYHLFPDVYFPDQSSGEWYWGSSLQIIIPPNPSQIGAGLSQLISVCPGANYTFSFWYNADVGAAACTLSYGFSKYQFGESPGFTTLAAQGAALSNSNLTAPSTTPLLLSGFVRLESSATTMTSNGTYLEVYLSCPPITPLTWVLLDSFQLHPK
jgi:hypothetical protein